MSIENDREFMDALLKGDNAAWDNMSQCVDNWLAYASRRHYIADSDIEDLRQEIIAKLVENNYEKLQQFSFRCRLSSWIGSIVNFHVFDYYTSEIRRERREIGFNELKKDIVEHEETDEKLIDRIDKSELIQEALEKLKTSEQEILKLVYWDNLMPKEIARITGERNSTITSRLSRARNKLRDVLLEKRKDKGERAI